MAVVLCGVDNSDLLQSSDGRCRRQHCWSRYIAYAIPFSFVSTHFDNFPLTLKLIMKKD